MSEAGKPLRTIQREMGRIDERLPYALYVMLSKRQADAMPLKITEGGVTYQAVDAKMRIDGYINTMVVTYQEVAP